MKNRKLLLTLVLSITLILILAIVIFTRQKSILTFNRIESYAKNTVAATWDFESGHGEALGEHEYIISVSPSGKYVLTVDAALSSSVQSGIPDNNFRIDDCYLALYLNNNGEYAQEARIGVDFLSDLSWSNVYVANIGLNSAWNADESRVLLAVGTRNEDSSSHVYLIDFANETIENLTQNRYESDLLVYSSCIDLLPKWIDENNICFIRYGFDDSGIDHFDLGEDAMNSYSMMLVRLISMNLFTGKLELLSDLSDMGRSAFVSDYEIYGGKVYFCRDAATYSSEMTGLFSACINGEEPQQTCLLNMQELRESNDHPYMLGFTSLRISQNGHWACLTVHDQRINHRDFPLADSPLMPQPDPGSATSITGRPWVPCHNVILYDLENDEMVNPFADTALNPDTAIVTAADFTPDGNSLLCSVFGDGGVWTMDSFDKFALYQIRLGDGSFDAVRMCETDISAAPPSTFSLLESNILWIKTSWTPTLRPMPRILML